MKYSIKINKLSNEDWNTKAFVSLVFGDKLKVNDITIRQAQNGALFVAMPGYKTSKTDDQGNPVYKNFCYPISAEFRKELFDNIIQAFKDNKKEVSVHPEEDKMDIGITMQQSSNNSFKCIGRFYIGKDFVVDGVKIIDSDKGPFVAMPTKSKTDGAGKTEYNQICYPITKEFREELYGAILDKGNEVVQKNEKHNADMVAELDEGYIEREGLPFR
ncbi:MAG: SpoVG family protein [Lachnospiraceae bacterium]|nr:SpoVG family protein [Lachnospiraceae bacterium]